MSTYTDQSGQKWRKGFRSIDHNQTKLPPPFAPNLKHAGFTRGGGYFYAILSDFGGGEAKYYFRWKPLNSDAASQAFVLCRVFKEQS